MTAVTDTTMTSTTSPHTARRIRPARYQGDPERWRISWMPDVQFTRAEALTGMLLAETAHLQATPRDRRRTEQLASELNLTAPAALGHIAQPPHELRRHHTLSLTCWCQPDTALDGHHDDGEVVFAATDDDAIDRDGFLLDEVAR